MTHRQIITALMDADLCVRGPRYNILRYFEHDALWHLVKCGRILKDDLLMLLIRDAETDGAFLLQIERDSILHVINGGNLDVSLATGNGCVAADSNGGGESVVLLQGDDSVA